MKDIYAELRKAYFILINGNISITPAGGGGATNIPIYDQIPKGASYPFIQFRSFDSNSISVKDTYIQTVRMNLDVYARYESAYGGSLDVDNIINQMLQLIVVAPANYPSVTGFNIITTKLAQRVSDKVNNENATIYIGSISIEHQIEQL